MPMSDEQAKHSTDIIAEAIIKQSEQIHDLVEIAMGQNRILKMALVTTILLTITTASLVIQVFYLS